MAASRPIFSTSTGSLVCTRGDIQPKIESDIRGGCLSPMWYLTFGSYTICHNEVGWLALEDRVRNEGGKASSHLVSWPQDVEDEDSYGLLGISGSSRARCFGLGSPTRYSLTQPESRPPRAPASAGWHSGRGGRRSQTWWWWDKEREKSGKGYEFKAPDGTTGT